MNLSEPLPKVLVMSRWWAEGPVKTRLAADVGQDAAREIYRQMAESLWQRLDSRSLQRVLWISPANRLTECAQWLPGATEVLAQPDGDLGVRLAAAVEHAFADSNPPSWVAVIGTDAPELDAAWLLRVGEALIEHDVVITPSEDGGYALLALKQPHAALFADIPWSTPEVLKVTLQRVRQTGLSATCTAPVCDLDDIEDLRALQAQGWIPPNAADRKGA
jgi:uncharacterized protein